MNKNLPVIIIVLIAVLAGIYFFSQSRKRVVENVKMLSSEESNRTPIVSETRTYFENISGYLAKPQTGGPYPGVVMIHEFWGLNDNIKSMADEMARNGYVVLAVDLYGEVTDDQNRARELSSSVNQEKATQNLRAAVQYIRQNEKSPKVASLGWCFGGGQSLQLAISGEPMDATAIYYGRLTSNKEELTKINWPVLGIFGDQDQVISVESVNDFKKALDELGIVNESYLYPGVGHAFANPSGMNYAPDETQDAWKKTLSFLERHMKS